MGRKALVVTVGTGPDVVRSLALTLGYHHPDFALFLATPESRIHAEAAARAHFREPSFAIDEFPEPADVEKLCLHYEDRIRRLLLEERGFRAEEVYADYTRGTKAMSAALDYVAIHLELAGISYIEGQRDSHGRVVSGTERVLTFRPYELLFRRWWGTLVELFNAGHFASVLSQAGHLSKGAVREEHRARLDLMSGLATACEAWESLHYEAAAQGFREALREYAELTRLLGLEDPVRRACETVFRIWNARCHGADCGCGLLLDERTAVDLLAHADRRAAEHRYDVAVALLYRLLEYLAQLGLHRRGLRSDDVLVDGLPENVRAKWESRVDSEGRLKVGLVHGFELLADLGDPVGRRFAELYRADRSPLKPYLETRNRSPLAHGFQPVGPEAFEKLREVVTRSFLQEFVPNWEAGLREHELPRFPEG